MKFGALTGARRTRGKSRRDAATQARKWARHPYFMLAFPRASPHTSPEMPASARSLIIPDGADCVVHAVSRCVRRAWLCGRDPYTGKDYEHRREWVWERVPDLAGVFAVEVCAYAIVSTLIQRVPTRTSRRPKFVATWAAAGLPQVPPRPPPHHPRRSRSDPRGAGRTASERGWASDPSWPCGLRRTSPRLQDSRRRPEGYAGQARRKTGEIRLTTASAPSHGFP